MTVFFFAQNILYSCDSFIFQVGRSDWKFTDQNWFWLRVWLAEFKFNCLILDFLLQYWLRESRRMEHNINFRVKFQDNGTETDI